uniref:Leucine-rich repeat-containing N-terminal plant-type domain-containing protein n=1 Tax=Quercus lobata TaxID=97700 RepID=A0A7N2L2D4_QUELO
MTKTTIFLSFLLLLFGRANSKSQLHDKEQTALLKLKQHWQNPPSLSHWQNPPSLSHLNPLNSSHHCNWPDISCTGGTATQLLLQNKNITQTVPPFICDPRTSRSLTFQTTSSLKSFLKLSTTVPSSKNLTSHRITSTAQSRWTFTACLACAALSMEPTASLVTFHHRLDSQTTSFFPKFLRAHYNCSKFEDLGLSQNNSTCTILVDIHQFSGVLPLDIISWKTLNTLNLRRNKISGPIPEELGNLAGLTELDLSENQLSGQIPPQLSLLKLTLLNLSSNHLIGRIPTQFENDAYASSFLNNLALCANKPSLNINSCNNSDHHKSSKVPSIYLALIISLAAAALLSLIVSISMIRKRKRPEFSYLINCEEWIGMGGTGEEEEENDDGIVTNAIIIKIMPRLQSLTIDGCPFLKSLPDYLLTAPLLKELEISGSQFLKERFQRGTGENWHKISHISNIKLDWVYVQRDGEP